MRCRLDITPVWLLLLCAVSADAGYLIDLDYACFRGQDSLTFVEVYTAIQEAAFVETSGDTVRSEFSIVLEMLDSSRAVISDTFSGYMERRNSEAEGEGRFFPRVFRFFMVPGEYEIHATVFDRTWMARERESMMMNVRAYPDTGLQLSDIEHACSMDFNADASSFVKSGVFVLPNATGFYGESLPMLYYYAEVYGLDYDPARLDSYAVIRRILQADNLKPVRPPAKRAHASPGVNAVIADGFPVSTLRTGTYFVELEVQSYRSGAIAIQRKKFWTYRDGDFEPGQVSRMEPEMSERLLASDPGILEIIEPDSALDLMKYLMNREDAKRLKRLTPEGRRLYLVEYWKNRENLEPGAANKYFARVSEANRRFSVLHKPGWRTDRGRVFIMHGEPSQTTRNVMEGWSINYETWEYDHLEGGVIFVFADYNEYGDYELVHSTMRGELYNPDWPQSVGSGLRTVPNSQYDR